MFNYVNLAGGIHEAPKRIQWHSLFLTVKVSRHLAFFIIHNIDLFAGRAVRFLLKEWRQYTWFGK
ncbi:hypothetical protein HMPREF9372_3731 [Sporosarcina newyorkensis 2681]|uniref:Uncharacterized protein n=1 Tax=Sporosarcina newyorkensis 2681 TaxID=1027292 RepID=F9DY50_9BACL|nr:hypothetical protein HMPREF9372_3731 [Sporosarcina newyorkensis 2681]